MKGTLWYDKSGIANTLCKGTFSFYFSLLTAARQLVQALGIQTLQPKRKEEVKRPAGKESQAPRSEPHTRSPESDEEQERKYVILLFLSLSRSSSSSVFLLVLPRSRILSLFARSLLFPFPLSLSPFPAPSAGDDDDEQGHHSNYTQPNGERQIEKSGERGCRRRQENARPSQVISFCINGCVFAVSC